MNDRHNKKRPKWMEKLFFLVHKHWEYHAPCTHLNIQAYQENKTWHVKAAPVFQEIYGGDDDGKKVWAGFIFDMGDFNRESGVHIEEWAIASYCQECNEHPKLMGRGKFEGHPIYLHIFMEPVADTEPAEMLDTIKHQIRDMPIPEKDENG